MIKITQPIRNLKKVQDFLATVPYGATKIAIQAIAEYLIGDETHGLKHDAPYKYKSRAQAYGQTGATFENGNPVPAGYFSAEQFRFVMARIARGQITPGTPNRTGATADAYTYKPTNGGYGATIENKSQGGYFTQHNTGQAAQPALVGWRKTAQNINENIKGALRHADAAVNAWMKNKGKG